MNLQDISPQFRSAFTIGRIKMRITCDKGNNSPQDTLDKIELIIAELEDIHEKEIDGLNFSIEKWMKWHREHLGWSQNTIELTLYLTDIATFDGMEIEQMKSTGKIVFEEWCVKDE